MHRNIVRHIGTAFALMAVLAITLPKTAEAATTYRVKYWAKVCNTRCHYVIRYKYVTLSRGTPKGVISYKPAYNVMAATTSRKGIKPKGATAVCADGKYVYTTAVISACAAHHGVAWKF